MDRHSGLVTVGLKEATGLPLKKIGFWLAGRWQVQVSIPWLVSLSSRLILFWSGQQEQVEGIDHRCLVPFLVVVWGRLLRLIPSRGI